MIAEPKVGIVTGRPGAAGKFPPASLEMMTAHEMAHLIKQEGKEVFLNDDAVIVLLNRVMRELDYGWVRTIDHSKEEFVDQKNMQKINIDEKGNVRESVATIDDVKNTEAPADVKSQIPFK